MHFHRKFAFLCLSFAESYDSQLSNSLTSTQNIHLLCAVEGRTGEGHRQSDTTGLSYPGKEKGEEGAGKGRSKKITVCVFGEGWGGGDRNEG